jgi:hypothetical protein
MENYLNQYRGVMPGDDDFFQATFEDRFIREF